MQGVSFIRFSAQLFLLVELAKDITAVDALELKETLFVSYRDDVQQRYGSLPPLLTEKFIGHVPQQGNPVWCSG